MIKITNNKKQNKKYVEVVFSKKIIKSKTFLNFESKFNSFSFDGKKIYVGLKTKEKILKDDWRILGFKLNQYISSLKIKNLNISLPKQCDEFLEGLLLANYKFDIYKSKTNKVKKVIQNLNVSNINIKRQLVKSKIKVNSQFLVRDWVNTTPEDANSHTISKAIQKHFKNSTVKVEVYGEDKLIKENMNGHLAVNRASRHEAMTVKLTLTPKKKFKKHIVMVGKGLTYDSGGLSIKPGNHMTTMKADKGGAMTVWGIIDAVSKIGTDNKVTCYLGLAENMIDGSAYKPDDVITFKNGKTAHIKNTDAEGRVVLFDNLCLAQSENKKIDELYTFATLTGARVYQFGDEATGMVGHNDKMKKVIKKVGEKEGEIFMNAEFQKYMLQHGIKDDLADFSNTGSRGMGCQKAGMFLLEAIEPKNKNKYLHLDIAGPRFVSTPFGTNPRGRTGFGVRTFANYLIKK